MDDTLKQIAVYAVTLVIFIVVAYIGYRILISTPVGQGLNQFLGGVGAVLGAVGSQLDTCATKGFFSSGCYLGWGGIGIVAAWLVASLAKYFNLNRKLSAYFARTGDNIGDYAEEIAKEFDAKWAGVENEIMTNSVGEDDDTIFARLEYAKGALAGAIGTNKEIASINSDTKSPASLKQQEIDAVKAAQSDLNETNAEEAGVDDKGKEVVDNAVEASAGEPN